MKSREYIFVSHFIVIICEDLRHIDVECVRSRAVAGHHLTGHSGKPLRGPNRNIDDKKCPTIIISFKLYVAFLPSISKSPYPDFLLQLCILDKCCKKICRAKNVHKWCLILLILFQET